jgi:nuclear transport factor 2 (NTF2) superfamily protein
MKKVVCALVTIIALGCAGDHDEKVVSSSITVQTFNYTLNGIGTQNTPLYSLTYSFDASGKVISTQYTSIDNPLINNVSTFEYNENGQVTKEIRKGKTHFSIVWTNHVAEVFNSLNQKISEFTFVGDLLVEYKTGFNSNSPRTRKLNYDSNQNVISIENETEIIVEFLDYNTEKENPFNLIKSIGILTIDKNPFSKNIFYVEKAYPYEDDDYSFPLTYYNYHYGFDEKGRVSTRRDDKTLIYSQKFIYQ